MVLRKFGVNDQSQKHLLNTYHVTDTFRYLKARLYCHHQYWFVHSSNKGTTGENQHRKYSRTQFINGANIGPNLLILVPMPQIPATSWKQKGNVKIHQSQSLPHQLQQF